MGVILANLIFLLITAIVSPEFFQAYGWRVPFLLSIFLIALALWIQLRLEDTPAFRHLQEAKERREEEMVQRTAQERGISVEEVRREIAAERQGSPVIEAFKTYPKQIALAAGAFVASTPTSTSSSRSSSPMERTRLSWGCRRARCSPPYS